MCSHEMFVNPTVPRVDLFVRPELSESKGLASLYGSLVKARHGRKKLDSRAHLSIIYLMEYCFPDCEMTEIFHTRMKHES